MNPYNRNSDADRNYIWDRLVAIDCEAFSLGDWSRVEPDFDAEAFQGVRCSISANPDDWKIAFPTLDAYRKSWLDASTEFRAKKFANLSHRDVLLKRAHLDLIDIEADRALAHKKFYGDVLLADGSSLTDRRQTLFMLNKRGGQWKVVGFFGQLPLLHI